MRTILGVFSAVVFVLVVAAVVAGFFALFFISNIGKTHGTHNVYVTAVETNGIIWSTDRAYVKTSQQSSQEDTYCVQDPAVLTQLKNAVALGTDVVITYDHPVVEWVWNCKGEDAIITAVK